MLRDHHRIKWGSLRLCSAEQLPTYLRSIQPSTQVGRRREMRAGWSTAYLTRTWTGGKIKPLLLKWWAPSVCSERGVGWGGAGEKRANAASDETQVQFNSGRIQASDVSTPSSSPTNLLRLANPYYTVDFSCTCTSLSVRKIFSAGTEVFMQLCFKALYRGGSVKTFRGCLQMPYHAGRGGRWAGGTHCSKAVQNHPNLGKRSNRSFKDLLLQRKELSSLLACPDSGAVLESMEICLVYGGTFHRWFKCHFTCPRGLALKYSVSPAR